MSQRQPPAIAVSGILFPEGPAESSLASLAEAVAATQVRVSEETLAKLAQRPARGIRATALAEVLLGVVESLHLYRHQRVPGWQYGTFASRKVVIEKFLAEAHLIAEKLPQNAEDCARAAFVFAAQDPFFGVPSMQWVVSDPQFPSLSRWPEDRLARVGAILSSELDRTGRFYAELAKVADELEVMIKSPEGGVPRQSVSALLAGLSRLIDLADQRPELQARVANMAWRVAVLSRSRREPWALEALMAAVAVWRSRCGDPHLHSWLD